MRSASSDPILEAAAPAEAPAEESLLAGASLAFELKDGEAVLRYGGRALLRHSRGRPCAALGTSRLKFALFKGRFRIRDRSRLSPLRGLAAEACPDGLLLRFTGRKGGFTLRARESGGLLRLAVKDCPPGAAFRLDLAAAPEERIFGCGEHFTRLDLRGERVRIWVEEHIGTLETIRKILLLGLGLRPRTRTFRRYSSYFPQPTFVSSARYFCHVDCDAHGALDFRSPRRHRILFHGAPREIVIGRGEDYPELLGKLGGLLGRQPPLPDWVHDGMILGIQDGTAACEDKLRRMRAAGAAVSGIWAQDWEGQRRTYFGKQLRWDYRWDRALYPGLDEAIRRWKAEGVSFLGYVNPYLCDDGLLFREAESRGFLARRKDGSTYLTTATSFPFGIVDLTNPAARAWFKDVIRNNMVGLGLRGWMADFGEYLPADARLAGGTGEEWHNRWPLLWARLNREVLAEAGLLGEAVFFTRSGYSGCAGETTLVWNGDQHVDWSGDYGLGSVVRASLSLAMSGVAVCHSDLGGYTTVPGVTRSKELFLRWLELCAFSPLMRSHEGNRPEANWQFDSDEETVAAVARFSSLHAALKPYLKAVEAEAADSGQPMMRPLFFHYEGDFGPDEDRAYLLGRDLAIYPVLESGAEVRRIVLPKDGWTRLFGGEEFGGGAHEVRAELGRPAVFWRRASGFAPLFAAVGGRFAPPPRG